MFYDKTGNTSLVLFLRKETMTSYIFKWVMVKRIIFYHIGRIVFVLKTKLYLIDVACLLFIFICLLAA